MIKAEVACIPCPLNKNCDPHLGPYKYKNQQIITAPTKFECPVYTCGDGRKDARRAIETGKPRIYQVEIGGVCTKIEAVLFGDNFQKFVGVIASFPAGDIFSLPPEGGKIYYPTGQSAFH